MNLGLKKIILLAGDIILLYASLYLALLIRYGEQPSPEIWQKHLWPFSLIFLAWLIIFYIADLYNLRLAVNNSAFFRLGLRSIIIAGLLSAVFFYLNPNINIAPKTNLAIFIFVFALLFFFWRRLYNWSLGYYLPKEQVLLIGYNGQVKGLVHALAKNPHLGYRITAVIADSADETLNVPIISDWRQIKEFIRDKHVTTIVLASDLRQSPELRSELFSCLPLKIEFVSLPDFYEKITGKVPIEAITQLWFLEKMNERGKRWFDAVKRAYDIIIALGLLALTLPLWPVIALLLKIENPEPVFFRQNRLGCHGRIFRIFKFRTQRTVDNDPRPSVQNDPRTTRIGAILRKTRIDEIPQVLNILAGDMSFIGPRPERPELVAKLKNEIPFYEERLLVKPGLTGSDQISGEYHSPTREDTLKKLQYDLFYIKNRSIYLDLSIILKTIATVIRRNGV
ncbi:MAG: sugar transferase [Planctomycetes bacterium]|jgi:exopolysaccharide biosynthesis polyprenyl glycosylphosphotransferase|nr:sugar transferase [Planctomycetota bacterium]